MTKHKTRPIDIEVWMGESRDGEFPGLHWDEVTEHPDTGEWMPFRQNKFTYGPYTCLHEVVRSVDYLKTDGYLRYIVLGGTALAFGPENTPRGEIVH
ncbi:MAG TPA: hypothetical protein EYQ00_08555 [Dehalococcoidia bacterium]|nr:hypothetical protein [Dehalococcoidia bacterium]